MRCWTRRYGCIKRVARAEQQQEQEREEESAAAAHLSPGRYTIARAADLEAADRGAGRRWGWGTRRGEARRTEGRLQGEPGMRGEGNKLVCIRCCSRWYGLVGGFAGQGLIWWSGINELLANRGVKGIVDGQSEMETVSNPGEALLFCSAPPPPLLTA